MINIKNLIKYSMILVLLLFSAMACYEHDTDGFLNKKPLGQAIEGDLDSGGFQERTFGLYGKLRSEDGATNWHKWFFQSLRSDDATKGSTASDITVLDNLDQYNYTASNDFLNNRWHSQYSVIYACNDLIADIDNSGNTDTEAILNKAEAIAIRALMYFNLRREYGQVPIILNKINSPTDAIKPKSTEAEVEAQIISDLEFAISNLPLSWPEFPGRASRGFANGLLAKVYLYRQEWSNALAKSEEVINSSQYSLFGNYDKLFRTDGNNCSESIFEVQVLMTPGVDPFKYSNNHFESQGVKGSGDWNRGFGLNVPTQTLVDAYEAGDPRKAATILERGQPDDDGEIVPVTGAQQYWNKKSYTTKSDRSYYGRLQNFWSNIKILRYADVILMAAEAANELADTATAAAYVNQVRSRVGMPPVVYTDQVSLRDKIKHERRIELALEYERFFDLVRWGDAVAILGPLGYQDKHKYYPISQKAIDESNGVLIQNPNY